MSIKSWIYADSLIKPEEAVLFQESVRGGLGLTSVKHKSKALLIRNFLEQSVNPKYSHSLFLETLFRVHIMDEASQCPKIPPYFNQEFFETIKSAHLSGYDLSNMKTKQWYNFLMEQDPTLSNPNKIELSSPETDWKLVWSNIHLKSLSNDSISFAWRLLHQLLPGEERLSRILKNTSPVCKFQCQEISNLKHIFFRCQKSRQVVEWLGKLFPDIFVNFPAAQISKLFTGNNEAVIWIIIESLKYIWEKRKRNKEISETECRASLEAAVDNLTGINDNISNEICQHLSM